MNDEKSDLQSQRVLLKKCDLLIAKMFIFFLSQCGRKIPAVWSSHYYIPPLQPKTKPLISAYDEICENQYTICVPLTRIRCWLV